MKLKWIGDTKGAAGLPGIPGRDLTADEVEQHGGKDALLATGLYEEVTVRGKAKAASTPPDTDDIDEKE